MDKGKVYNALKGGVECKTKKTLFNKYKHCFSGEKAVAFLLSTGIVKNRKMGKRVVNEFVKDGLIAALDGKKGSPNDPLRLSQSYRFCLKIEPVDAAKIVEKLKNSALSIKSRKQRRSTYRNCFVGCECIDAMILEGIARDRHEGYQVGNALIDMTPPYIEVVTGETMFQDDQFFFRFCEVPKIDDGNKSAKNASVIPPQPIEEKVDDTLTVPQPVTKRAPSTFSELYMEGERLGRGAFSVVVEAVHRYEKKTFAVKIVTKSKLSDEDERSLADEISALKVLKHKNIIKLYDVFDEGKHMYLVTELMRGGELFDRIISKSQYTEKEARDLCKSLFETLSYCHSKRIVHRDLKPENLLLVSENNDSAVKIADFGFAKTAPDEESLSTQCGTPTYVAPEILEGYMYGTQVDMWSLGVIVFTVLGGYNPFVADTQRALFRKIRDGKFEYHDKFWGKVSDKAKDLISRLLTVSPDARITAEEALDSDWIKEDSATLSKFDLGLGQAELKKFNLKKKFKGAARAVIISNKMDSLGETLVEDLRRSINN